jgi:hypothetical protein
VHITERVVTHRVLQASQVQLWRQDLGFFERVDVCQLPEYHLAYATRIEDAQPIMWIFEQGADRFAYPFLQAPVTVRGTDGKLHKTAYSDISSIYGYSGPLSTSRDKNFMDHAWKAFSEWAKMQGIIAEFSRYSLFAKTKENAHIQTTVEQNRLSAITEMPKTADELFSALEKKTRNMIRKAQGQGLTAKRLDIKKYIGDFRAIYDSTMQRNDAPAFFYYDDTYYQRLLSLPDDEVRLYGAFVEDRMVATCISLSYKQGALYHLGASLPEFAKAGANNLVLFEMSKDMLESGITYLNMGGGKTTAEDDALLRFKKSNATGLDGYYIGKRVLDQAAYAEVIALWEEVNSKKMDSGNLLFYR